MKKIIIRVFVLICALICAWVLSIVMTPVEPETFAFTDEELLVYIGQEKQFVDLDVLYPDESYAYIKCVCKDENITEILDNFYVKGKALGTTTITCNVGDKELGNLKVTVGRK